MWSKMQMINITELFLKINPNCIFIFGDNLKRTGKGGAAVLRDVSNTYGFITKKSPTHLDKDYYTVEEYKDVYKEEVSCLIEIIKQTPNKIWIMSKIGAGLANKYNIWEEIIKPNIKNDLKDYSNIIWLF